MRSRPLLRLSPLSLSLSSQMRVRRRFGSRAYSEETREFRCEVDGPSDARALTELLEEILGPSGAPAATD